MQKRPLTTRTPATRLTQKRTYSPHPQQNTLNPDPPTPPALPNASCCTRDDNDGFDLCGVVCCGRQCGACSAIYSRHTVTKPCHWVLVSSCVSFVRPRSSEPKPNRTGSPHPPTHRPTHPPTHPPTHQQIPKASKDLEGSMGELPMEPLEKTSGLKVGRKQKAFLDGHFGSHVPDIGRGGLKLVSEG